MSNQSPKKLPTLRDSKDPEQLDIFQREVRELFRRQELDNQAVTQNITNIYGGVGTVTSVTGTAPIDVTPTTGAVNVSLLGTYVNSLTASGAITLSGSTGNVTIGTNLSAYPTGSGTLNTVAKWTPSGTQLGNSSITDSGTLVQVNNPTVLARNALGVGFVAGIATEFIRENGTSQINIGPAIEFQAPYLGTAVTEAALIKVMKTNNTNGHYSFDLVLGTRPNGGNLTEVLRLYDGVVNNGVKVSGNLNVTGSTTLGDNSTVDTTTINGTAFIRRGSGAAGLVLGDNSTKDWTYYLNGTDLNLLEYASVFGTGGNNRVAFMTGGGMRLGDTASTAIDPNLDTLTIGNTSQQTANVTAVNIDLTGQTDGDMKNAVTRNTYGAGIYNPTQPWVTGTPSESDPGVLNNFGLSTIVSGGFHGTNYAVYADASGNTTNYAFYGAAGLLHNAGDADFGNNVAVTGTLSAAEVDTHVVNNPGPNSDLILTGTFGSTSVITSTDLYVGGSTPFSGPYGAKNLIVAGDATVKGPNGVTVSALAGAQPQYVLSQTGQATWYIYEPASTSDLKFFSTGTGTPVAYFDGLTGNFSLSYDLAVAGNTTLGNAQTDSHTVNGKLTIASGTPAAAASALELVVGRNTGGSPGTLAGNQGDVAFQWGGGGYRHFISTQHDSATTAGNAMRFWVNSSGTSGGSSAPATGNANVLDLYGDGSAKFYGNVVIGDNSGTDSLTVKQGTAPTGLVAAPAGSVIVIEQANGTSGYLAFRSNTASGLSWANSGSGTDGMLTYNSSVRAMQFATATTNRLMIDSNGGIFAGDTSGSAIANNVDVFTIGNTGTGQTASTALLNMSHTGSFATAGGGIVANGINVSITSTRASGANNLQNRAALLTASGAQQNTALQTVDGDVSLNTTSGNTTCFQNFSVNGNATLGDASADTHTLNGNITLQNSPAAGPVKYGALQARIYIKRQVFTANGTYTPSTGCKAVRIKLVGGGGGGGGAGGGSTVRSAGGGGSSGAYLEHWIEPGTDITGGAVTIGAAGTAGASTGTAGGNGGDTSVVVQAVTYTAKGGTGGAGCTTSTNYTLSVNPQAGSTATDIVSGGAGTAGIANSGGAILVAGNGGSNPLGYGGVTATSSAGSAGTGYGAGGSGGHHAGTTDVAGGAGTAGIVIIEEYA